MPATYSCSNGPFRIQPGQPEVSRTGVCVGAGGLRMGRPKTNAAPKLIDEAQGDKLRLKK